MSAGPERADRPATAVQQCPVVGCTGAADQTFVVAFLPAEGTAQCYVHGCAACWRRTGDCEPVRVEFQPDDIGRRQPRVRIGAVGPPTRD